MFSSPQSIAEARAAQGVAFLSAKNPLWFKGIDIATLDIGDGRTCMLAQLAGGSWTKGNKQYNVRDASMQENLGFHVSPDIPDHQERYRQLTIAWRRAVIALEAGTYVGSVSYDLAMAA